MLDVPESLLDERRRLGLDVFDEVWEGVLHMVPPPSEEHQRLELELGSVFLLAAKRRGLVASNRDQTVAADDNYHVPDIVVSLAGQLAATVGSTTEPSWWSSCGLPVTRSYEKLQWYAARGVAGMLIVDPADASVRGVPQRRWRHNGRP